MKNQVQVGDSIAVVAPSGGFTDGLTQSRPKYSIKSATGVRAIGDMRYQQRRRDMKYFFYVVIALAALAGVCLGVLIVLVR